MRYKLKWKLVLVFFDLCAKTQQTISIQLVTTQNINNATTSGGKRATQSVPITRLLEHQRPSK